MINHTAFNRILREYEERQLENSRSAERRKASVEARIPELKSIEAKIAEQSVSLGIARIRHQADAAGQCTKRIASLKARKSQLLEQAGITPEDLQPVYTCSLCHDTGYVGDRMCSCFRSRLIDVLYDQSNIKEVLKEENFRTFSYRYYSAQPLKEGGASPREIARKAVDKAHEFVEHFDNSADNLFICGNTGVGKTFLTNCIAEALLSQGKYVLYLSAIRLFEILADANFRNRTPQTAEDGTFLARQIYDCDLLIIDDLGTEMVNSFTTNQLFHCINERLLARKHTIISSNLSAAQMQANYSERIWSRIADRYILIKLFGDDIRMKKKLED